MERAPERNFPSAPRRADWESCPWSGMAGSPRVRRRIESRWVSFTVRVKIMVVAPGKCVERRAVR